MCIRDRGTYLDIVVDEIPYKACKQNPQGLNIIHRLPVRPDSGSSIIYYKSNSNYAHIIYRKNYVVNENNSKQLYLGIQKAGNLKSIICSI